MLKRFLIFLICLLPIYISFGQQEFSVRISIPQRSGLASADYKAFEIKGNKLYEIKEGYLWDKSAKPKILKKYKIPDSLLKEFKRVISKTDSLGSHTGLCDISLGVPRFFISFNDKGRMRDGFIANVYRDHIFRIVDLFNKIIPGHLIINYNKDELIQTEEKCKEELLRRVKS